MQLRFRASLIHLGLSGTVVSLFAVIVLLLWYPTPYGTAMGIMKILGLLFTVDVVLGPLLTLILFNPNKRFLTFDLAAIATLQLAALVYGAMTVISGRPVFVVYNVDRFTVVSRNEIPEPEMARAGTPALPLKGPRVVGARLPEDRQAQARILSSAISGGADLAQMPAFYIPYAAVAEEVKAHALSRAGLLAAQTPVRQAKAQALIDAALQESGLAATEVGFVPLRAKAQDMTVMVRRADARIVTIFPLDPWGS